MIKKWLCIVGLVGSLVSVGLAQDATREASPMSRVINPITSVELAQADDGYELVIKGDLPDGCDIPTTINTEKVGETTFVDLYREVPFDTVCPEMLQSYEEHVNISDLIDLTDPTHPVNLVVINGKIYSVEALDPDSAPVINELWARGGLSYEHIVIKHAQEGDMSITLSGTLSDSCPIPVYRAVPDWQNKGFTAVEAYTAISLNAMCAQAITPFEVTFNTPVFDTVAINGVSVPFDPTMNIDTQEFLEQPLSITTATAEWVEGLLPNIKITVIGTTDGCDFPIQMVSQKSGDNTYVVKVVRVVPSQTICTMIARDFTQELMLAPQMTGDTPVTIIIGDKTITMD